MKDHWHYWRGDTLFLKVHITPQSRLDAICGLHNNRVSIKLHAPPVDGKANKEMIEMLAQEFAAGKLCVRISAGAQGPDKLVSISGPRCLPAWFREMRHDAKSALHHAAGFFEPVSYPTTDHQKSGARRMCW